MRLKILINSVFLLANIVAISLFAQQDDVHFIETEYSIGKIVPNYTKIFPKSSPQQAFTLSIGKLNIDSNSWGKYYHHPETGVSMMFSTLGNNKVFGNQFSLMPFIKYRVLNQKKNLFIKLSLGITYFTTHFDSITNIDNLSNGSSITWGFQAMLYKTIYQTDNFNVKLVGGYSHHSNGHTQLPNFGLNSALFGVSTQWKKNKIASSISNLQSPPDSYRGSNLQSNIKRYFIHYREGLGFHELGATDKPVGGDKKIVYTTSLAVDFLFNNHIKWKTGFSYRYYEHYYDYIIKNDLTEYNNNPEWSASNIYFFTGVEFLMNHFAIDIEGGLNLYKPFYKKYNEDFQKDDYIAYQLKKWFNARLGLNYYLINTIKSPKNNIFLGAHINANFGQADFSEFSIGFMHSF